jgi:hypothetical protein
MFGLLFIYFVGKAFYKLAEEHQKKKWLYGILGVLSFYGGMFGGGFILGAVLGLLYPNILDEFSETTLGLMTIPIGLIACRVFFVLLKRQWGKSPEIKSDTLLDGDISE